MRALLASVIAAALGCGSSGAGAPTIPEPVEQPAPQVLDVATVDAYAVGFRYQATVHREVEGLAFDPLAWEAQGTGVQASAFTEDLVYTVEVLDVTGGEIARVRIAFGAMRSDAPDVGPLEIAGHSYDLGADGATRTGGAAITERELAQLGGFVAQGGLIVPVRDGLAGVRLAKGQPVALETPRLWAVIGAQMPAIPSRATATLRDVSEVGLATIDLAAEGTLQGIDEPSTWEVEGEAVVEAETLLPHRIDLTVTYSVSSSAGPASGSMKVQRGYEYGRTAE